MTHTAIEVSKLPTLQQLSETNALALYEADKLNAYLNQDPPKQWVKEHPVVAGHKYVPIDKVEMMLRIIFREYRIEVTGQGTAFNGVWVTVRVHYKHPIHGTWEFHDGIGAKQLQTKKGSSPAQLENINNGAIEMAFPIAKTLAVKDACDHFGRLFGSDLNRKDLTPFKEPVQPGVVTNNLDPEVQDALDLITDLEGLDKYVAQLTSNDKSWNNNWAFRSALEATRKRVTPKN